MYRIDKFCALHQPSMGSHSTLPSCIHPCCLAGSWERYSWLKTLHTHLRNSESPNVLYTRLSLLSSSLSLSPFQLSFSFKPSLGRSCFYIFISQLSASSLLMMLLVVGVVFFWRGGEMQLLLIVASFQLRTLSREDLNLKIPCKLVSMISYIY